jgi:SAM-dependent methyltransferase
MVSQNDTYTTAFYSAYVGDSYQSAKEVLPVIEELLHPKRIVDVGCGVGTWLRVWQELGASCIVGVDGSYVKPTDLLIDAQDFVSMDLTQPRPVAGAPFDLVQSLEVAEHLPPEAAARFVSFLCTLSPVVLFSAAIPGQGGTSHVNEQWPEYWADLFRANGYHVVDIVREKVWDNPAVAYYYAQNALLFVSKDCAHTVPSLIAMDESKPLAKVHPRKWEESVKSVPRLEHLLAAMPASTSMFVKRVVRRAQRTVTPTTSALSK